MITKEQKALAIARAEGWKLARFKSRHENKYNKVGYGYKRENDLIQEFCSYNALMPIVAEYNNVGIYEITINAHCIKVVITDPFNKHKPIEKDFEIEDDLVEFSSKSLLDALLDAVYFVLVESKELKC